MKGELAHLKGEHMVSILCPWLIFISIYVATRAIYDLHSAALGFFKCPCYLLLVYFIVLSC
uniref:Uncharacterized protein n=1 Tax=Zea mays TaxID=4577 RepID=A0A804LEF8_MAIZE